MKHVFSAIALSSALASAPISLHAQSQTFTLDQARALMALAVQKGDFGLAYSLANGLLQANPKDRNALVFASLSSTRLNRPDEARSFGKRAFAVSNKGPQKFEAARLTALAAAQGGKFGASQFWLRRASNHTSTPQETQVVRRDYAIAKQQNPWRISGSFSIVPSDNVNGGTFNETTEDIYFNGQILTGTFSGDAKALPGAIASTSLSLGYRLSTSQTHETSLTLYRYDRTVFLNDEAKEIAPDADGSDYEQSVTELRLGQIQAIGNGRLQTLLTFGDVDYGGEDLYQFARLNAGWQGAITPRLGWSVSGTHEQRFDGENAAAADQVQSLSFGLNYKLLDQSTVYGRIDLGQTKSDAFNSRNTRQGLTLGYLPSEPLWGVDWSANVSYTEADYPDYSFLGSTGGRQDEILSIGLKLSSPKFEFAGFVPQISIQHQQTQSTVSRFDTRTNSAYIEFKSSF